jgi:2-polyprenyl-3-methyl-5-hydroxy-6-metoxy-1,4-benzoquinol methylase
MSNIPGSCSLCSSRETKILFSCETWRVCTCSNCSNAWNDPSPTWIEYEKENFSSTALCSGGHKPLTTFESLPRQWKNSIRIQTDALTQNLKYGAKVLEIGCGEGILLKELENKGFNVTGVEPSEAGSAIARQRGLNVVTGYFPHPEISGSFDVVILSHTLEHLADPIDILRKITNLSPGGYILLVQTNYLGLVPHLRKSNWYAWAPHAHYWHFTPEGLSYIMQPLGFCTVAVKYYPLVHTLGSLLRGDPSLLLSQVGYLKPKLFDQFHILLRQSNAEVPDLNSRLEMET